MQRFLMFFFPSVAVVYLFWRLIYCIKHRLPAPPEVSILIYLVVLGIFCMFQPFSVGTCLGSLVVSFIASFYAMRVYNNWLHRKKDKE